MKMSNNPRKWSFTTCNNRHKWHQNLMKSSNILQPKQQDGRRLCQTCQQSPQMTSFHFFFLCKVSKPGKILTYIKVIYNCSIQLYSPLYWHCDIVIFFGYLSNMYINVISKFTNKYFDLSVIWCRNCVN